MNYKIVRTSPCSSFGRIIATSERGFAPDGREEIVIPIRVSPEPERSYIDNYVELLEECEL